VIVTRAATEEEHACAMAVRANIDPAGVPEGIPS